MTSHGPISTSACSRFQANVRISPWRSILSRRKLNRFWGSLIGQPSRASATTPCCSCFITPERASARPWVCVPSTCHSVNPRHVRLFGKGNKERICPLWRDTAVALQRLQVVRNTQPQDWMFCNRGGACLTRDGVAYILQKYTASAARAAPTLRRRHVTPHMLRHSCAVALLQAGVDITVIRDYLGHASISTTSRYVSTNLQMKRDALEHFWERSGLSPARARPWSPKPDLLAYLASI